MTPKNKSWGFSIYIMKLLIENFRRFINEQETMFFGGEGMSEDGSPPEDKYFGRIIKIANQIKQIHNKFIEQTTQMYARTLTVDDVDVEKQLFIDEVEKQTEAKLIGCGKFRCVFDVNDDYVIKIDITPRGSAKEQNETDALLGKRGYGNLFAKSYLADKDHSWVILEKVKPFNKSDIHEFVSYFPNKNVDLSGYTMLHYALVLICFAYHKGKKQVAQSKLDQVLNVKRIYAPDNLPTLDIIADGFTQRNPYDKVVRVITELGIRPEEIRVSNTGKGVDGRFVIIDSSLENQIRKGFEEPDIAPVAASPKPKAVPATTTMKVV